MTEQRSAECVFIENRETKKELVQAFSRWFYNRTLKKAEVDVLAEKIAAHAEMVAAVENGETAGFVAYYRNDLAGRAAFITVVIVRPRFRGRGLGKAMLQTVIADCFAHGFQTVRLEVDDANRGAVRLYERLSFQRERACSQTSSYYVCLREKNNG